MASTRGFDPRLGTRGLDPKLENRKERMRAKYAATFRRTFAAAAMTGALVLAGMHFGSSPSALAKSLDEYATWDDVVAAQGDVDRQNKLIDEIHVEIKELKGQVAEAEQVAQEKGNLYSQAQQAANEAAGQQYTLEQQANDAANRASEAETEAGSMTAAMANRVSNDPTLQLLAQPEQADDFLKSMSTLSKLGSHSGTVYESAVIERNNADQLNEQAKVALEERQRLESEAQTAYREAQQAQAEAQKARDHALERGAELEAMLAPLEERRDVVEADYREGERLREIERKRIEEQRRREEEERRRRAEEERAAAAAAAASSPAPSAPSGGGGGGGGAQSSSGISGPIGAGAWVSDPFGYRLHPVYGTWRLHAGLDLVVNGTCGTPLYAVTSGTVTYAGWTDGYGNMVDFTSDDGVNTFRYAHIMPGGIAVGWGEHVSTGQVIAYAGTTGPSTGCHLHIEITEYGNLVDPQPWFAARGIYYY